MKKLVFFLPLAFLCSVISAQQDVIPNAPGVKVHPSGQIPEKTRMHGETTSPALSDTAQSKFSGEHSGPKSKNDPSGTGANETAPAFVQPKTKKK